MALKNGHDGGSNEFVCDEEEFAHNTGHYSVCSPKEQPKSHCDFSRKYLCPRLRIYLDNFLKNIYITLQLIQVQVQVTIPWSQWNY